MTARETVNEVYATAQMIAQEAFAEAVKQCGGGSDMDEVLERAREYMWESIDGTLDVIYYSRAGAVVEAFNQLEGVVFRDAEDWLLDIGEEYKSYDEHVVALSFALHLDIATDALASIGEGQ